MVDEGNQRVSGDFHFKNDGANTSDEEVVGEGATDGDYEGETCVSKCGEDIRENILCGGVDTAVAQGAR